MAMMRTEHKRSAREAFTLIELMIAVAILALLMVVSVTGWKRLADHSKAEATQLTLEALAGAISAYENEFHVYPVARFVHLGLVPVPAPMVGLNNPNVDESIEVLLYQLAKYPPAAQVIDKLPAEMIKARAAKVVAGLAGVAVQEYPLSVVVDAWGNPVQYVPPAYDTVTKQFARGTIRLVSVGPDGQPGTAPAVPVDEGGNTYYPDPGRLGTGDDIVIRAGMAR